MYVSIAIEANTAGSQRRERGDGDRPTGGEAGSSGDELALAVMATSSIAHG